MATVKLLDESIALGELDEMGAWVADDPDVVALLHDEAKWRRRPAFRTDGTADDSIAVRDCFEYKGMFTVEAIVEGAVNGWQLLKYGRGGHFVKHTDTVLPPTERTAHIATALLLPPLCMFPHEGGELCTFDADGSVDRCIRADATRWTRIVLPLGVAHQVLPVLSDLPRLVFKTAVHGRAPTPTPIPRPSIQLHWGGAVGIGSRGALADGGGMRTMYTARQTKEDCKKEDEDGADVNKLGGLFGGDDDDDDW